MLRAGPEAPPAYRTSRFRRLMASPQSRKVFSHSCVVTSFGLTPEQSLGDEKVAQPEGAWQAFEYWQQLPVMGSLAHTVTPREGQSLLAGFCGQQQEPFSQSCLRILVTSVRVEPGSRPPVPPSKPAGYGMVLTLM